VVCAQIAALLHVGDVGVCITVQHLVTLSRERAAVDMIVRVRDIVMIAALDMIALLQHIVLLHNTRRMPIASAFAGVRTPLTDSMAMVVYLLPGCIACIPLAQVHVLTVVGDEQRARLANVLTFLL